MVFKKSNLGWILIIVLSVSPLIPWLIVLHPLSARFANVSAIFTSIGEITGLIGVSMFALNLLLSIRLKFYEDLFGGMNRVYIAHHIFGGVALLILLVHPLALAASLLPYSLKSAALYILPGEDWSINIGIAAFLSLMALLILTLFIKIPYQIWRFTHKFLGPVFFLAALHGLYVSSDITRYPLMRMYMLPFYTIGILAYTYKTLLGRFLIRKYRYTVVSVKQLQDNTVEISLSPQGKKMDFTPGQFVFIRLKGTGVSNEVHPFSMSSSDTDPALTFTVKAEGDYTSTLHLLKPGDTAFIEGSYGRFSYRRFHFTNQIWIAGGIGITPFVSMVKTVSDPYAIDLYYSVRTEAEAIYLSELQQFSVKNPKFRVFPFFTKTQGRLTADIIAKLSGDMLSKDIFICGPPPMMASMKKQLISLHVPKDHIHSEEFNMQ